ncbi:hypothetical protein CRV00_09900 [Malaciobacter molluscorum]|uniref:hypothetical protein n=1 Tax=Malaciobacter molluscorum TaxID=1032072 RepID=UPI00100A57A3|nr:hypothetical protein [Malaciobacter molluscorum]RXJ93765.1 hypothetical protein CRV00_09900 [Malaciobacter molluscorum]
MGINPDIDYLYDTYFKEYEEKQEDAKSFKEDIKSIIGYIYEEIEFSKEHFRFKENGIEMDYHADFKSFNKNVEKYKKVFGVSDVFLSIKKPQRTNKIFAMNYNYLTHLDIKEKTIKEVFAIIRDDLFGVEKTPVVTKAQTELKENFYKVEQSMKKASIEWKKLVNDNPKLSKDELLKKFIK